MRERVVGLILAVVIGSGAWGEEARISVSGAPSYPERNRLKNSDFSQGRGDKIADWQFNTAVPSNFEAGSSPLGHDGPGSAWIKTHTGSMSGYWGQSVPTTPGERLMVWVWIRSGGGKSLLYLTGDVQPPQGVRYQFDERAMLTSIKSIPLAPLWIKTEYLRGPDLDAWSLLQRTIEIPQGMQALGVHIGSYFMRGEMWADDFYVGPAEMDMKVTVEGAEGAGGEIRRVRVVTDKGAAALDSGALAAGTRHWAQALQHLDAGARYVAEATMADGKVVKAEAFPPLAL